jgi:hypothetical protein
VRIGELPNSRSDRRIVCASDSRERQDGGLQQSLLPCRVIMEGQNTQLRTDRPKSERLGRSPPPGQRLPPRKLRRPASWVRFGMADLQVLYRELAAWRFDGLDAVLVCALSSPWPPPPHARSQRASVARQQRRVALSARRLRGQTGESGVDVVEERALEQLPLRDLAKIWPSEPVLRDSVIMRSFLSPSFATVAKLGLGRFSQRITLRDWTG